MNVAPTPLRTPVETELVERFGKVSGVLPGTEAVRARRAEAFALFEMKGLPHRRVEEWKYSDLRARLKKSATLAARPDDKAAATALKAVSDTFAAVDRYRVVLVDGFFQEALSDVDELSKEGVAVATLSDLLATNDDGASLFSVPDIAEGDIAVALNTAFTADGVVITVPTGARLSKPLQVLNVATPGVPSAVYARSRIVVGDDVEATILETSLGGAEESEINLVTDYQVGENTKLTVARLQVAEAGATHIASGLIHVGGQTELTYLNTEAGAGFSRNQMFVTFAGEHSHADIFGLSMLHGTRHADQTLVVDHAVPHCSGAELFKSVIDDRASGVFQGKIIVRRDSQKTDSKMMSQALLLSEGAEMASKPELEIFADDVVCGHGSTSGQIDANMLFYLMARGIPRPEAERLLIEAFLADAVDAIRDEPVADALKGTIAVWLNARNAAREAKAA